MEICVDLEGKLGVAKFYILWCVAGGSPEGAFDILAYHTTC